MRLPQSRQTSKQDQELAMGVGSPVWLLTVALMARPLHALCNCRGELRPYILGGACKKGSWEEKYALEMFGLLDCPGCCIPTQTIEKAKKVHKCFGPRTLSLDVQTASAEKKSIAWQMQVRLQGQQGNWTALEDKIDHANKRLNNAKEELKMAKSKRLPDNLRYKATERMLDLESTVMSLELQRTSNVAGLAFDVPTARARPTVLGGVTTGASDKARQDGLSGGDVDVIMFMTGGPHDSPAKIKKLMRCYPNVKILFHLSDEFCRFPDFWEVYPKFKLVLRQYACWSKYKAHYTKNKNVKVIPLGYGAGQIPRGESSVSIAKNRLADLEVNRRPRKWSWAFAGTMKQDRKEALDTLDDVTPHPPKTHWPTEEIHALYGDANFVINGRGNANLDCFRIYEAAIEGAIPIVVSSKLGEIDADFAHFANRIPFVNASTWSEARVLVKSMLKNPETVRSRQRLMLQWWLAEMDGIKMSVSIAMG